MSPPRYRSSLKMSLLNTMYLLAVQILLIGSCSFGLYKLSAVRAFSVFSLVLYGIFYILGLACSLFGLLSSIYGLMASDDDEEHLEGGKYSATENSRYYVQYHYLLAWLTVVVGYPSVVVHAWMVHYNNTSAQLHFLLMVPPLICWVRKSPSEIAITTQITGFIAVASHAYIEHLAGDRIGIAGAFVMFCCLITIAVPTKHRLFGLTAREFYLTFLALSAYIFAKNIESAWNIPTRVTKLTLPGMKRSSRNDF